MALCLLAIETSSVNCSAALWRDGAVLAREALAGQSHSELLLPMIDGLLAESGMGLSALSGIAFGAGPGAFTGLRIACGVAQGLAFGAGLPVVPVSTLHAVAQATSAGRVFACLDARMGEVYHAWLCREGEGWRSEAGPLLAAPAAVHPLPGAWTGCGSGFAVHRQALETALGEALAGVAGCAEAHAREVAALAAPVLARGGGLDPAEALPVYVRDKVALTTPEQAALRARTGGAA